VIYNGQSASGAGFFCKYLWSFTVSIITPISYTDNLFTYHRRVVILPFVSVVQWKRSRSAVEILPAEELTF